MRQRLARLLQQTAYRLDPSLRPKAAPTAITYTGGAPQAGASILYTLGGRGLFPEKYIYPHGRQP